MKHINNYRIYTLVLFLVCLVSLSCTTNKNDDFSVRTKIALRDVGNKLLLSNQDSTSLILPIIELEYTVYNLSFNSPLSIEPSNLVSIMKESLDTSKLPQHYQVEVLQCSDREVAYSYQMSSKEESTIVPCSGRFLPKACYSIEVKFTNRIVEGSNNEIMFYLISLLFLFIVIYFIYKKKRADRNIKEPNSTERLGSFYFYPEQNKLIKEKQEIALSKKECELLTIFVASPNKVIKRDELTKRVWEDNGVFVGRSLDTYISKLRKKLKDDDSIKLTNVHGVGYKLEIS